MRKTAIAGGVAAAGLAASVAALGLGGTAGTAATTGGVGAGSVSTSVLDARLGDLLGVRLLEDVASATTDPKIGTVGASSVFRQLQVTSSITTAEPSLNQVVGEHRVSAPGGPTDVTTSALDLSSASLPAVVTGTVAPLVLKAAAAPGSATSSSARASDVGLLGGLASLGAVEAADRTGSAAASADVGRTMSLDALSLLDLGHLLAGLGLDVLGLPLSVVSQLVTSTGIPLDLRGAADLAALVTGLSQSILALQDSLDTNITADLLNALQGAGLPAPLRPALDTVVNGPGGAIASLQATLTSLIDGVVAQLEGVTLLKVSALDVGTVAKAAGTVSGSVATATGHIGSLQVGPATLAGLDLGAASGAVDALLARVQGALDALLAPLGFTDLLGLRLFDRETGVSQAAGVVRAVSRITGLVVTLHPPSVDGLTEPPDPFGSHRPPPVQSGRTAARSAKAATTASRAAGTVSAAAVTNPLDAVLSSGLGEAPLLSSGLELRLGTVASESLHSAPAAPVVPASPTPAAPASPTPAAPTPATATTPAGTLPRTGGEQTRFGLLAMGLGAAALGTRRLRRRARP